MLTGILATAVILILTIALTGTVFVLGLRVKSPIVQRSIIWLTKHVFNPRQMRTAGQPGAYAAIIRTVGRRTGRVYETPVGVVAAGDDFIVTLPYGQRAQWLKNVLATGQATLVYEGSTYGVDRPELVPTTEVEACFSPADQRTNRLFGMDRCLRLRRATSDAADQSAAASMGATTSQGSDAGDLAAVEGLAA